MKIYTEEEKALIFLSTYEFMTFKKYEEVLSLFENLNIEKKS